MGRRFLSSIVFLVSLLTTVPHSAFAFPAEPFNSELQAMMLAQEADTQFLPFFAVATSSIPFTSKIFPGNATAGGFI
jgi:hypothetical protein